MECIAATIKSDRFEGRGEASVTTGVRGLAVNLGRGSRSRAGDPGDCPGAGDVVSPIPKAGLGAVRPDSMAKNRPIVSLPLSRATGAMTAGIPDRARADVPADGCIKMERR